jgi:hypothetical protein
MSRHLGLRPVTHHRVTIHLALELNVEAEDMPHAAAAARLLASDALPTLVGRTRSGWSPTVGDHEAKVTSVGIEDVHVSTTPPKGA